MESTVENKYGLLKRKMYLVLFPILFITNVTYWLFSPYTDPFMKLVLPPICFLTIIFWILIYFKRLIRTTEIITFVLFSIYHLYRIHYLPEQLASGFINVYVLWSPLYYIYTFMALERKNALLFSLCIWAISIAMGIFHFNNPVVRDTLIQFYISSFLYILILFYFKIIVSSYIESDILRKNAFSDFLTDIGNRRSLDTWLDNEINQSRINKSVFSVIYFDIDYFKRINDKYGHDIGDLVLKEFSSYVKSYLQPSQFFGRWGGEEFMIISTKQSLTEATQFAEILRKGIEQYSFRYVDQITSSFGVSSFQEDDTPKTLIKRADQALYLAKNKGRNLVEAC